MLARRFLTTDEARPDKVAGWHAKGRRTARENIADLVDDGSFVEYGRFITPAQEGRRDVLELVIEGPADGFIGGTATVVGLPCTVLSYSGRRSPSATRASSSSGLSIPASRRNTSRQRGSKRCSPTTSGSRSGSLK